MNNDVIATALECIGFKEARQEDVLNYRIPYCRYLYREHNGQHQYIWLTTYEGEIVESLIEVFLVPRNSRAKYNPDISQQEKMGYRALHCVLARTLEGILSQLDSVYPTFKEREAATKTQKNV